MAPTELESVKEMAKVGIGEVLDELDRERVLTT
jgi:hypothetical protein